MDEILVHISAPATRQNDDLYRSLADAYFDFEPYRPDGDKHIETRNEQENLATTDLKATPVPTDEDSGHVCVAVPMSTASKDSYGSFPSQVSSGNYLNLRCSFGSVEDGSPLPTSRLGQLERIQANWRINQDPGLTLRHEESTSIKSLDSSGNNDITFIEDSQLAARAIESQLFDNASTTSEDVSEDESEDDPNLPLKSKGTVPMVGNADFVPRRRGEPTELPSMSEISATALRAGNDAHKSAELGSKLQKSQAAIALATSDSRSSVENINAVPRLLDFSKFSNEVFAPAPIISTECPDTLPSQVTTYLGAIKQQNSERFRPSMRLRTLDADERGYWLIESATWPTKVQYEFWLSICDHVHSGRFGWGVTLHRDPQTVGTRASRNAHELGQVRLYCWGEIVEHIWLSLWLCSKGKVASSGSRWLDAEDVVVIQIP